MLCQQEQSQTSQLHPRQFFPRKKKSSPGQDLNPRHSAVYVSAQPTELPGQPEEVGHGAIFTLPKIAAWNVIRRIYLQCAAFSLREGRIFQTQLCNSSEKGKAQRVLFRAFSAYLPTEATIFISLLQLSCFPPNLCVDTVTGSYQVGDHRGRLQG